MINIFNDTIKTNLNSQLGELEKYFNSDVIFFYGEIHPAYLTILRDFIEDLKSDESSKKRLTILINTPGGVAEAVEKFVDIIRFHYNEVYFVVPDLALSAGTIFCMSGDRIYMDYSSSLGPIDPQVSVNDQYVPALGYLDQVEKLLQKSKDGTLTAAEFAILKDLDLAMLRRYEQARDLTVTLLKNWLVKYKFKNWKTHQSDPKLLGEIVTKKQKEGRAEEIATKLGNNSYWHSHGRMINIATLQNYLKLKIDDYSNDIKLRGTIRQYNDLIIEFIRRINSKFFLHSKRYF